jgi:hypothetical protein
MGNKQNKKNDSKAEIKKEETKKEVEMTPETYDFSKVDPSKRIIGVEIEDVLKRDNITEENKLPQVIQFLMDYIEKNIPNTTQIFKLEGTKTETNVLTYHIDTQKITYEEIEKYNIHVAVAVLKKYIRELPGGLLPYAKFAALGGIF